MEETSFKSSNSSGFPSGDYTSSLHDLPLLSAGKYDDIEEDSAPIVTLNTRLQDWMMGDESTDEEPEDYAPDPREYYSHFYRESERLTTFHDWPHWANVTKEELAKNGFLYLHVSDRVQCVFCRASLGSFKQGDVIANEHRKYCPECPLAFGYECGNIPISSGTRVSQATPEHALNRTNLLRTTAARNFANSSLRSGLFQTTSTLNLADTAVFVTQSQSAATLSSIHSNQEEAAAISEPKYRDWADEHTRLLSYRGWPAHMKQTPRDLAAAGLLYMGQADRCKCYWCGGELHGWEPNDIPLIEHEKWFPQCGFVRQQKGIEYVMNIKHGEGFTNKKQTAAQEQRRPTIFSSSQPGLLVNRSDCSVVMTAHGQLVAQPSDATDDATSQSSADDQGLGHGPNSVQLYNQRLQNQSYTSDSSS
ncbi:hypothetical protein DPMN_046228 [Dreissena polymorpha]|uniref:Uncharacterized protein n=1 Tax=Dreissena polymorpha TaxID=45954 RepID=A0A9D4D7H0_DREPO|nr:hypothetical protein DPMN_046228 [Dreissena polymorpha]